jgi:hypothetical protein
LPIIQESNLSDLICSESPYSSSSSSSSSLSFNLPSSIFERDISAVSGLLTVSNFVNELVLILSRESTSVETKREVLEFGIKSIAQEAKKNNSSKESFLQVLLPLFRYANILQANPNEDPINMALACGLLNLAKNTFKKEIEVLTRIPPSLNESFFIFIIT